jgi:DNA-binding NtrC family response regulator
VKNSKAEPEAKVAMDVSLQLAPIDGKVLVIEDEPILRNLMVEILREVNVECVEFPNADDALMHLLLSRDKFALLIVDHGLPGQVQGAELVEYVRSRWPEIPAIITSGWTDTLVGLPANSIFLAKPWNLEALLTAVAAMTNPEHP